MKSCTRGYSILEDWMACPIPDAVVSDSARASGSRLLPSRSFASGLHSWEFGTGSTQARGVVPWVVAKVEDPQS